MIIQGTREWTDYEVRADVTPHMVEAAGLAARVQGMKRYYALNLCRGNKVRLVKALAPAVLPEPSSPCWETSRYLGGATEAETVEVRCTLDE